MQILTRNSLGCSPLILLFVTTWASSSFASTCVRLKPPDAEELFIAADVVFEGEVQKSGDAPGISYERVTEFKVLQSWKGSSKSQLTIHTDLHGSACSLIEFIPGMKYVVFASKRDVTTLFTSGTESFVAEQAPGDGLVQFMVAKRQPVADRAAALAMRGETAHARDLLSAPDVSRDPAELFVLVCVELDEGHIAAASRALLQLRSLKAHAPEVLVLTKVVEERRRAPYGSWTEAFVKAWKAAGRPRRTDGLWLAPRARPPIASDALGGVGGASGLVIAFAEAEGDPNPFVTQALNQANRPEAPFAVQLIALALLSNDKLSEPKRSDAHAAARSLLSRLSIAYPDNGYFAASVALAVPPRNEHPLSEPELDALEDAVKKPIFELPLRPLFVTFQAAYELAKLGQASSSAFYEAVNALPMDGAFTLWRRAQATEPRLLPRTVAVMEAAGTRLGAGRSILERMVGLTLQVRAARLRGDAVGAEAVAKARVELLGAAAAMDPLMDFDWPIAAFWRDWYDRCSIDEMAVARSLSR